MISNALRGVVTETVNDDVDAEYLQLENEMEIDEALSKLTARLETLKGRDKLMRIGNNQFELNDKDPIYFISGPEKK